MGDPIHLEKMGTELKCPICLSLLNSAVSLTCNHVFCNSCIVKSMKSGLNCPVCKVPYRRREIHPAPHMDNLVSIYKSMEVASGFNIFVSQNPPATKLSDEKKREEDSRDVTNGAKGSRKNSKRLEPSGSISGKPSFPAKKRVQVPHSPILETPIPPKKLQTGTVEKIKGGSKNSSLDKKEDLVINEKGEPVLSPFFWLREEENAEKLSQQTDEDLFMSITPPNVATFSDMKDSDDENPSKSPKMGEVHSASNVADLFDSEMFEWTQRACSPELDTSPFQTVAEDGDEIYRMQEHKSEAPSGVANKDEVCSTENEKTVDIKLGSDDLLPSVSCRRVKGTNNQNRCKKSLKTCPNYEELTLKKCANRKQNSDLEVSVLSRTESGDIMQKKAFHKDNSLDVEKIGKKATKVRFGTSKTESKPNVPSVSFRAENLNLRDKKKASELPVSSSKEQGGNEESNLKTRKLSRKANSQGGHTHCSLRSKKRKVESTKINMIEEVHAKNPMNDDANRRLSLLYVPQIDGKKVKSAPSSECNKLNYRKNRKVSFSVALEDKLLTDHQGHSNVFVNNPQFSETIRSVPTKETQSMKNVKGKPSAEILDNSAILRKLCQPKGVILDKCETVACKLQCAFCFSSEDSEVSGEMVHYCNGRPVAADYDGGSKVIHTHRNCAQWAPNVYFEHDAIINLEAELARSRRIKCCCCGLKGAALGCYERSCRKSFHVPCAKLTPQCRWDSENFVMLCPLHVSSKLPCEDQDSQERRKKHVSKRQRDIQCNQVLQQDISAPQRWNTCGTFNKVVLCCSALTATEKEIVSEFEKFSGVTILKNWDLSITHVIASTDQNGACKRTIKTLMGILEGKWLLNIEWVKACMKAMKTVEEEQYEITVDIHGIRDGPRLGRQRLLNKEPKIFEGFTFYFMGDFVPSYKGYIQDLIIAGGGTILLRKPISEAQGSSVSDSSAPIYIIYSLEPPDKCVPSKLNVILNRRQSDAEALASSTGAKAVSNLWVLNSIASCKLISFGD